MAGTLANVEVLSESQSGQLYTVSIKAIVDEFGTCTKNQHLHKSVAVTSFNRLHPLEASVGRLGNIDTKLSAYLAGQLYSQYSIFAESLVKTNHDFRVTNDQKHNQQSIAGIREALNAQLIITGTVTGMAMQYPKNLGKKTYLSIYAKKLWRKLSDTEHEDTRLFSLNIQVYEAHTGQLIFEQDYTTKGQWNINRHLVVRFASPQYWNSGYGKQVEKLLTDMLEDISRKIICQPFISTLAVKKSETGETILYHGSNHGIQKGDILKVYLRNDMNILRHQKTHNMQLIDQKAKLVLNQVYPTYSVGTVLSLGHAYGSYVGISW